jgi:hypothetical protein
VDRHLLLLGDAAADSGADPGTTDASAADPDPGPADARATHASWSDAAADTKADSACCTYPAANSSTSTNTSA